VPSSVRVIRHPEVPQELEAAAVWYEECQSGLGEDFLVEYQATTASSTSIAFLMPSSIACMPTSFT
jgi:hypothetical protein